MYSEVNSMNVKRLRERAGLTQEELAKRAGVSVPTIRGFDREARNINKAELETLINISNALGCRISDLLTDGKLVEKCKTARL